MASLNRLHIKRSLVHISIVVARRLHCAEKPAGQPWGIQFNGLVGRGHEALIYRCLYSTRRFCARPCEVLLWRGRDAMRRHAAENLGIAALMCDSGTLPRSRSLTVTGPQRFFCSDHCCGKKPRVAGMNLRRKAPTEC
jgi:hypothetical protein